MTEGAQWNPKPQAESNLQKMARGTTQEAGAEWNMPEDAQGPPDTKSTPEDIDGDTHQLIEGKMDERIAGMTEETGAGGDVHQYAQRGMNEMAREMFEEDWRRF